VTDKPHILVVEDEVSIQDLLKTRLKKLYEISCATYQDEAFAALQNSAFDLVLLDLKLPRNRSDMNPSTDVGVDILRQVRERNISRRGTASPLPVVVMTAFGKDKLLSADFLQHRGACDYVQKPFGDGKALKRKIEIALFDEGTFSGPSRNTIKVVQLRFNTSEKVVLVEKSNTRAPITISSSRCEMSSLMTLVPLSLRASFVASARTNSRPSGRLKSLPCGVASRHSARR